MVCYGGEREARERRARQSQKDSASEAPPMALIQSTQHAKVLYFGALSSVFW
jgi:hypothetical protein